MGFRSLPLDTLEPFTFLSYVEGGLSVSMMYYFQLGFQPIYQWIEVREAREYLT